MGDGTSWAKLDSTYVWNAAPERDAAPFTSDVVLAAISNAITGQALASAEFHC